MSNKHETALALIDEQIEKEERQLKTQQEKVTKAQNELKSTEAEEKLIQWSLRELRNSRSALLFDRGANNITEEASEVP